MCGRFVLQNSGQIPLRFAATADTAVQAALADRYNIAPTEAVPIVTEGAPGERQVELAAWGLTPRWRGAKPVVAFNARAETLTERPMFRGLVARSRCVVPASGWYEWTAVPGQQAKQPWFITDPDGDDLLGLHDRMPVVLPRTAEAIWLDPGVTAAEAVLPLLAHPAADRLRRWPVSTAVNRSGHSAPALIGPLNPA